MMGCSFFALKQRLKYGIVYNLNCKIPFLELKYIIQILAISLTAKILIVYTIKAY